MTEEPNDPTQSGSLTGASGTGIRPTRNEIAALCAKAARGAGMSWGLAEEAGFATAWLHLHGIDGAEALLSHLDRTAGRSWDQVCPVVQVGHWRPSGETALCPVALGSTLSDHCDQPEAHIDEGGLAVGPVSMPVILLPFLAQIAALWLRPIVASWDDGAVLIDPMGGITGDVDALAQLQIAPLNLTVGAGETTPVTDTPTMPASAPETLDRLNRFAMKTTVPPSQRSRADAGSGGADND